VSSLIYCTEERQVSLATDTLATLPDGRPFEYTTKAFVLPHLRTIIAGTGAGGFLGTWFVRVNDGMVVSGVDHLNFHTAGVLASQWEDFKKGKSLSDGQTTTIYHFGFSETTGLIHSFAYRSTNNFQSESIGYGIGVKPKCKVPDNCRFPQDLKTMMDEQRTIQRSLPEDERVYIGGEIQIHHLSKDGFRIYTLDRFEDYDQDNTAIYENCAAART
jgi:hypothetical protein